MSQTVEAFSLDPCGLQNTIVPFSKVHRSDIVAVFVRDQECILSEVTLCPQILYGIDGGLIKGHIPFAGGSFQLAYLYLEATGGLSAFATDIV